MYVIAGRRPANWKIRFLSSLRAAILLVRLPGGSMNSMNSISSMNSLRPDILLVASLLGCDYACGQSQQLSKLIELNKLNELK